jgi:hypothetical protein
MPFAARLNLELARDYLAARDPFTARLALRCLYDALGSPATMSRAMRSAIFVAINQTRAAIGKAEARP